MLDGTFDQTLMLAIVVSQKRLSLEVIESIAMMKIIDIEAQHTASSVGEVEAILRQRFDSDANAFSLSHNDEDFPMLSVLVKDKLATLNFLERSDEPGFVPTGNALGLNPNENTVFRASRDRADDVEVQNDAVVSFLAALEAAKEFFVTKDLPKCVEWFEL